MSDVLADYGPNRSAPHAVEAEEAVLGCVLINPESYWEAVAIGLAGTDFYLHKNRWIWNAFTLLADANVPVDTITVSTVLEEQTQLGEAGGTAYLTQLINAVPTSLHMRAYAKLVITESRRRQLIEIATEAAHLAYKADLDPADAAAQIAKQLMPIAAGTERTGGFMRDLVPKHFEHLRELATLPPEEQGELTTGIPEWDTLTQGLFRGDYDIIGGDPGAGKSALMLHLAAVNASRYDLAGLDKIAHKVAYFCLEMPRVQVLDRLFAHGAVVEVQKFRRAKFNDEDWTSIVNVTGPLGDYELYIDCNPILTPIQFRATCEWLLMEWGLDLAIVDYLQLMLPDPSARPENRTQEVSGISKSLRRTSLELNLSVLAGSQLSRAKATRSDKRPVLSDLRESGSLEQDATGVHLLFPDPLQPGVGQILTDKLRNGRVGTTAYVFDKAHARFRGATVAHIDLRNI